MADGDLTTLENVRAFLQKQDADTAQDDVIQSLITQASSAITRYTRRQFVPEDAATHRFEVELPNDLMLINFDPFELRTLSVIELDTDTEDPTALTAEEFKLWPRDSADQTFLGVRVNPFTQVAPNAFRWGMTRELAVTGNWGMAGVPADVVNWCNVTVALWLRREVAAFETGLRMDAEFMERPKSLPSAVSSGLDQYRRMSAP